MFWIIILAIINGILIIGCFVYVIFVRNKRRLIKILSLIVLAVSIFELALGLNMRNSLLDMNSVFLFNTAQKVLYDLEILKILSTLVLGLILMIKKIKYLREKTEQENMSNLR